MIFEYGGKQSFRPTFILSVLNNDRTPSNPTPQSKFNHIKVGTTEDDFFYT